MEAVHAYNIRAKLLGDCVNCFVNDAYDIKIKTHSINPPYNPLLLHTNSLTRDIIHYRHCAFFFVCVLPTF